MDKDYFEVTEQHVKLLRAANVSWASDEFGAPAINCKRPYGNSNVYEDVAEILGIIPEGDGEELTPKQESELNFIHRGTETALQIFLATGEMKAGHYEALKYTNEWKPQ